MSSCVIYWGKWKFILNFLKHGLQPLWNSGNHGITIFYIRTNFPIKSRKIYGIATQCHGNQWIWSMWSIQQKSCLVLIRYHSLSSFHQGCHFLLHFESLTKWRKKWKNQSIQICRCHKSHKICYDQKKMPCFSLKPIIFIWNNSKLLL